MNLKILFLILFLLASPSVFSKEESSPKSLEKTSSQSNTAENIKNLKDCNVSEQSQKALKSYNINSLDSFPSSQIKELVSSQFSYMRVGWPKSCPSHCRQVNNYTILSKVYPKSISEDSCKKEERTETYSFKKQFALQKKKGSIVTAHKKMREWIFSVFVNPYYPFATPGKEFVEYKLDSACPSCSFYLDYSYKYTKENNLELDITARCGDKKRLFSSFKMDFILVNDWKCEKKSDTVITTSK